MQMHFDFNECDTYITICNNKHNTKWYNNFNKKKKLVLIRKWQTNVLVVIFYWFFFFLIFWEWFIEFIALLAAQSFEYCSWKVKSIKIKAREFLVMYSKSWVIFPEIVHATQSDEYTGKGLVGWWHRVYH